MESTLTTLNQKLQKKDSLLQLYSKKLKDMIKNVNSLKTVIIELKTSEQIAKKNQAELVEEVHQLRADNKEVLMANNELEIKLKQFEENGSIGGFGGEETGGRKVEELQHEVSVYKGLAEKLKLRLNRAINDLEFYRKVIRKQQEKQQDRG